MCLNTVDTPAPAMINKNKLGPAVRGMLTSAKMERRLVCGLLPAIAYLEQSPDDVIFCVLPESRPGDATTHIQTVLLEAFCYENYIPVIQVDSSKKLAYYCGVSNKDQKGCNCAIVIRKTEMDSPLSEGNVPQMSKIEQSLADFYEFTLELFPKPIIELPI